ncbi:hypothetical protein [Amycolatopsis pithecellobii]|uniref:Uncharacterized protein n=1 Tax=Amycolatopsis pithecellobii TaxID=664692 RepID=A0A6N7Z1N6_9PSEU|nr:hypothetical protein [Amycolatopsis pithecellobii]MTD54719.1 hypothetical protein [Amycolatopsis pithecellobii]
MATTLIPRPQMHDKPRVGPRAPPCGFREPFEHRHGYDVFHFGQKTEPFSLLNLEIPVIVAINGPLPWRRRAHAVP